MFAAQLAVPGFSQEGQSRLRQAAVLVLGSGTIAAVTVQALRASGFENVAINGDTGCSAGDGELENAVNKSVLIIDLLDDWQDKLVLSDLCMSLSRPLLHCSGSDSRYQLFCMVPGKSSCLRCLLATLGLEDSIEARGRRDILISLAGLIGNALALSAVKIVSKFGASQSNELIKIDALSGEIEVVRGFDPVSDCPDCGVIRRRL